MSEEIKSTTEKISEGDLNEDRITVKARNKKEKTMKVKKERSAAQKKKTRRIVIFSILGVLVIGIAALAVKSARTLPTVTVGTPTRGEIIQYIDSSGSINSLDKKVYFSAIDGKYDEVRVALGDSVKKGDILLSYNQEDIDKDIEEANLKKAAADGSYSNSIQSNGRTCSNLNEALGALPDLQAKIEYAKGVIKLLEKNIDDKKAALSYEGSRLQISLLENDPGTDDYLSLQKLVQDNSYQQQNNSEIREWQAQLKDAENILSDLKSDEAEMKSKKNSSKDATLTKGAKEELEANHESTLMELDEKISLLNEAKSGIAAEYDGVVTKLDAVAGGNVATGSEMITLESLENVVVGIELTKFDMENVKIGQKAEISLNGIDYMGEVSHLNKMAEQNRNGATVVGAQVRIDNPDENLILGLDAKVKIIIGQNDSALLVPNEQVLYDKDGAFVYICPEGKIEKRHVVLGLVDDLNSEIKEGLDENDTIVINLPEGIEEGTEVNIMEQ